MIAEAGLAALWLAAMMAVLQLLIASGAVATGREEMTRAVRPVAIAQGGLTALAMLCLILVFARSDMSVLLVAENSHSLKPMIYKIAGAWGNHEGSMLLWVTILGLAGGAVAIFERRLDTRTLNATIGAQALIALGFYAFLLFASNPFARLFPSPLDGNGLNPLLQDPGLAFHPPTLYVGYVGISVAFSFAVGALVTREVGPAFARAMRPWVLGAWIFLTIGITAGSYWAYYELGWGGWWFWDPVENASFMPWLVGTALLHCQTVVEKRDALKVWTIMLAILAFGFSLLGTFLVRSGVITSVHAFAQDPARGLFILLILGIALGGSFALFAWRAPHLSPGGLFAPISREGALVLNNLLLSVGAATVLLGTLYPLALSVIGGSAVSVGWPYYVVTFVPLMVPMVLLMAVGPLLGWKRGDLPGALQRLAVAGVLAVFAAGYTLSRETGSSWLAPLGIALGVWLFVGTLVEWTERVRLFRARPKESWNRARHLPRRAYGMTLAHIGLAVAIVGMTGSAAWKSESVKTMRLGESVTLGDFTYRFDGVEPIRGPNYLAERGTFTVTRDGKPYTVLHPERRQYEVQEMPTTEAAIESSIRGDIYAVIGDRTGEQAWTVRIYHQPLVPWIWAGGLLMALGGIVSLSDRRYRIGVPNRLPVVQATGA